MPGRGARAASSDSSVRGCKEDMCMGGLAAARDEVARAAASSILIGAPYILPWWGIGLKTAESEELMK